MRDDYERMEATNACLRAMADSLYDEDVHDDYRYRWESPEDYKFHHLSEQIRVLEGRLEELRRARRVMGYEGPGVLNTPTGMQEVPQKGRAAKTARDLSKP